jgi:hypothetical protein
MASQILAQGNLNIPPALIQNGMDAGIPAPRVAANPPNPVDVSNAVKLKAVVAHELGQFFFKMALMKQITQLSFSPRQTRSHRRSRSGG